MTPVMHIAFRKVLERVRINSRGKYFLIEKEFDFDVNMRKMMGDTNAIYDLRNEIQDQLIEVDPQYLRMIGQARDI